MLEPRVIDPSFSDLRSSRTAIVNAVQHCAQAVPKHARTRRVGSPAAPKFNEVRMITQWVGPRQLPRLVARKISQVAKTTGTVAAIEVKAHPKLRPHTSHYPKLLKFEQ